MHRTKELSFFLPRRKQVGEQHLTYTLYCVRGAYGLSVCADAGEEDQILVDDIARDLASAKRLQALFAENLVFPANVPEILDDLLGGGQI